MTCSLFIVTCAEHKHWIRPCLKSLKHFCSGISEIVLLVPFKDKPQVDSAVVGFDVNVVGFDQIDGHGFNHHQAMICHADEFCSGDFVVHLDIDCLFTERTDFIQEYFSELKPVLLKESYKNLNWHSQILEWKRTTEEALGFECLYETMRRHPAVHHRWIYRFLRNHIQSVHQIPLTDYFINQPERVGISEFNVLGAFVHEMVPTKYHFINIGTEKRPKDKLIQGVSYHEVDQKLLRRLNLSE